MTETDLRMELASGSVGANASIVAWTVRICPFHTRHLPLLLALILCASQTGCQFKNWLTARSAPPSVLPPDATIEEIVDHLNINIERLDGWKATDVRISVHQKRPLPSIKLSSTISVERPRNFRLTASLGSQRQVDLGANDEKFWLWMSRGEPAVFTCRHEDVGNALRELPIPIQPDWLVETLGVVPLDGTHLVLHRSETDANIVSLISDEYSPQGRPVRKVVVVDLYRGVIREYVLYDSRGAVMARAVLSDHRTDAASGVTLPHRIDLEWPHEDQRLTLDIRHFDVNPPHFPRQMWSIPQIPGIPEYDLGR
jgi:hypothetical protein